MKIIVNLFILIVAILLFWILFLPSIIWTFFYFLFICKNPKEKIAHWLLRWAVSIDQLGNVVFASFFNDIMIKKGGERLFGDEDETISSVLGKNKKKGMLSFMGRGVDWILNKLDFNHSIKNIEIDEGL